jgi:hypothetical protein
MRPGALCGVLQNNTAPLSVDEAPFFDFLKGSKAAKADQVIIQTAIAYARRLNGAVAIIHAAF